MRSNWETVQPTRLCQLSVTNLPLPTTNLDRAMNDRTSAQKEKMLLRIPCSIQILLVAWQNQGVGINKERDYLAGLRLDMQLAIRPNKQELEQHTKSHNPYRGGRHPKIPDAAVRKETWQDKATANRPMKGGVTLVVPHTCNHLM